MKAQYQEGERRWRFALEITVTTVFWGLWLYVVMPLISALLWVAGVHVFVEQMFVLGGYEALIERLSAYGGVVLAMLAVISLWIAWNVRHYGHRNTRTHALAAVTLMEQGAAAGVDAERLADLHLARRLTVRFGDNEELILEGNAAEDPPPAVRG
jgi:poly-beta-1,6-N-acetyl-D-glucosamine biosynthesis protein PgaD